MAVSRASTTPKRTTTTRIMAAFRLARLSPFGDHLAIDPFRRVTPVLVNPFPTFMPQMHAEMDRMFDMILSPRVRGTAPSLEAEDREFLAGAQPPQEHQKTDESSEACQENSPRTHPMAWSSSSFSSFSSSGGGPAVQTTTKRVYDGETGEVREVRRRSVGEQLVVEHRIHRDDGQTPETNSTRQLHNIDEAQMEEFESHFSSSADTGSRADHATLEQVPAPAPPPLAVSPEDVATLHHVMPELSESDATDLLRQHDGNLRAAMRAGLHE